MFKLNYKHIFFLTDRKENNYQQMQDKLTEINYKKLKDTYKAYKPV